MSAVLAGAPPSRPRRPGRDPRAVARELRVLLVFRLSAGGRDPRRSVALIVLLALGLGVGVPVGVAVWIARLTGADNRFDAQLLTPTAWTAFLLTATLAAISGAGGRELLSRDRAVAFPVSAAADHLGALALTPLNVAWSIQAVGLLSLTAFSLGWTQVLLPALVATALWIAASTAVGQLIGWFTELVRTLRFGRPALWALTAASTSGALVVVISGRSIATLDRLPTTAVYVGSLVTSPGRYVLTQLTVVLVTAVCVVVAVPLVELLSRRPTLDRNRHEARHHRRSVVDTSTFRTAVVMDVRSVLRSPPLCRGLVLLVLTPLGVAVLVELPWSGVLLLPALVAAGTSLLYGVNAAALDGRGALWRESLPEQPHVRFWARTTAMAMMGGASAALVVGAAAVRSTSTPSRPETVAAVAAVVVATTQVVSHCALWTLQHPFASGLQHPRDTPAPPARMAAYSLRLSATTTLGALVLVAAALGGRTSAVLATALVMVLPGAFRLARAHRMYLRPDVRARVASTVSGT